MFCSRFTTTTMPNWLTWDSDICFTFSTSSEGCRARHTSDLDTFSGCCLNTACFLLRLNLWTCHMLVWCGQVCIPCPPSGVYMYIMCKRTLIFLSHSWVPRTKASLHQSLLLTKKLAEFWYTEQQATGWSKTFHLTQGRQVTCAVQAHASALTKYHN